MDTLYLRNTTDLQRNKIKVICIKIDQNEKFQELDLETEGTALANLTKLLMKNGNTPIPFPDNSDAKTYYRLINLGFFTQSEEGVKLSEEWYAQCGGKKR